LPLDVLPIVCPHDCPSACALEVERIDGTRIGRVRGAAAQTYTRGVDCAKVARYAERQHHPERLSHPLRCIGDKDVGRSAFTPISWDAALDEVAERLTRAACHYGSETVWPYYYSGTMGLAQRDGINRLRHAMRYAAPCPAPAGWQGSGSCAASTEERWPNRT
jgi:anaerobic selenocysteine-containing dehydrogenase